MKIVSECFANISTSSNIFADCERILKIFTTWTKLRKRVGFLGIKSDPTSIGGGVGEGEDKFTFS